MSDYVESGWGFLNDSPGSSSEISNDSSGSSNDSSGSYAHGDNVSGVDFSIPSSAPAPVVPASTPAMTTGFGSWFGANTGSTASSQVVQDTIQAAIDKAIKLKKEEMGRNMLSTQEHNQTISDVMENLYPSLPTMSKEDFLSQGGEEWEYDYLTENFSGYQGGTGNLMNMGSGVPLPGHVGIDTLNYQGYGGGGGGGWGSYGYGYGGGGGGGGGGVGGGYYGSPSGIPRGNPNELWGQQAPWLQAMINTHGGPGFQQGFARGGIVSLVT